MSRSRLIQLGRKIDPLAVLALLLVAGMVYQMSGLAYILWGWLTSPMGLGIIAFWVAIAVVIQLYKRLSRSRSRVSRAHQQSKPASARRDPA